MRGSQRPDYLSFDDIGGEREECKVYFYEQKNIYCLLIQWCVFFNFRLGHFVSLSFDT